MNRKKIFGKVMTLVAAMTISCASFDAVHAQVNIPVSDETILFNQENEFNLATSLLKNESTKASGLSKLDGLANKGFVPAQAYLGEYYRSIKDMDNACKYLNMAAKNNDVESMCSLGFIFIKGENGVKKDVTSGVRYLEKAARNNHALSNYNLGYIYENGEDDLSPNLEKAYKYYEKAAELGNANAINKQGEFIETSKHDKTKEGNPSLAFVLYNKASNMGSRAGIYNVGRCYMKGIGTMQNVKKGAEYLRQSAEMGYAKAKYEYGVALLNGNGVAQNKKEGERLIDEAKKEGVPIP